MSCLKVISLQVRFVTLGFNQHLEWRGNGLRIVLKILKLKTVFEDTNSFISSLRCIFLIMSFCLS